jgi:prepilin-type N-terminal cleavage/methylation domain-containing protein
MCPARNATRRRRRGLTLIELMISIAVTTVLLGAIAGMASTVNQAARFNTGQNDAVQHARVTLDRIERLVGEAYALETYPGVVVVDETVGSYRYPDTLVIWHPNGTPANLAGPPLVKELVIICPNPANSGELIEVRATADTRTVQLNDAALNTSSGRSFINGIKTATSSTKTQLTPLLSSAATSTSNNATKRGSVRFECELHPTAAEMTSFRNSSTTWDALNWPQNLTSSTFGLRQVWVRSELQLLSEPRNADGTTTATTMALPFFGSATLYYTLKK